MADPNGTERRPIDGLLGFEIDALCNLYLSGSDEKLQVEWPWCHVEIADYVLAVEVSEATALSFIDLETRNALWEAHLGQQRASKADPHIREVARKLGVSEWAVLVCTQKHSSEFSLPKRLAALARGEVDDTMRVHRIVDAAFTKYYAPLLDEPARSPAKGGNNKALHSHMIEITEHRYTFKALGAKKWAFVGDRVSFSYTIDTANRRRIIKRTFKTVDKLGREVERGERGYKRTLRTAAQRMPVSRRELRSADRD